MKIIVITGSTRGIGRGLAENFLQRGCALVVGGRSMDTSQQAAEELGQEYGRDKVLDQACDVTDFDQVQRLWEKSVEHFGQVDIWINNAGWSDYSYPLWEHTPEDIRSMVETNLVGLIYGSKVAVEGMLAQGSGSIYNMEGMGSDGRRIEGLALYGTTKYGEHYFTESLVEETRGTPVLVGMISPGMVLTDLLTTRRVRDPKQQVRAERAFKILADPVEKVTPWLADQILQNTRHGKRIRWLTPAKVIRRMLLAPFRMR